VDGKTSETVAILKDYNIAEHYISKHKEKYKNFVHALRREKLAALERRYESQEMSLEKNSLLVIMHCGKLIVLLTSYLKNESFSRWKFVKNVSATHTARDFMYNTKRLLERLLF
jgi:hypothetical protein